MTTAAQPNDRADATAPPAAAAAASPSASPTPTPSPQPVSTVAAAGKSNSYIWTKADYFFGSKCECKAGSAGATATAAPCDEKEEEELVAAGAGVPSPSNVWLYARAAVIAVFVATNALALVNFCVLPINLAAFGWILFRVVRHSNSSSTGSSTAADQSCDCSEIKSSRWSPLALRTTDLLVGWFLSMVSVVVERVMGMRVRLSGDVVTEEQRGEGALIISNHPSTADWIYIWSWMVRQGDMSALKIALKRSLHSSPIVGWALQCARYLFLARDWQKDQVHIESVVKHWASTGAPLAGIMETDAKAAAPSSSSSSSSSSPSPSPVQLLLFPEGTDLRPVSYDQSCAFVRKSAASDKAVVPLQHVLQPRTTGFVHIVQLLRQSGSVKAVYDLTLGSAPVPVTIENFARGVAPSEFSVHAQRFELSSLPQSDAELAAWLQKRWAEKDAKLEGFYSSNPHAFPSSAAHQQLAVGSARQLQFRQFSLLAAFVLMFLLHAYCWFVAPLAMIIAHTILSATWVYITRTYGGFDTLMLKIDQMDQKDTPRTNKKNK